MSKNSKFDHDTTVAASVKKGFKIVKDEVSDENYVFLQAFRGMDARKNNVLVSKGFNLTLEVPVNTLIYEELLETKPMINHPKQTITEVIDLIPRGEILYPTYSKVLAYGGDPGSFSNGYWGLGERLEI